MTSPVRRGRTTSTGTTPLSGSLPGPVFKTMIPSLYHYHLGLLFNKCSSPKMNIYKGIIYQFRKFTIHCGWPLEQRSLYIFSHLYLSSLAISLLFYNNFFFSAIPVVYMRTFWLLNKNDYFIYNNQKSTIEWLIWRDFI